MKRLSLKKFLVPNIFKVLMPQVSARGYLLYRHPEVKMVLFSYACCSNFTVKF